MKPKRVIIVHGWDGFPEEAWFPWLKRELEKNGVKVDVPQMPSPELPVMEKWVPHLAKTVGKPDGSTCFVGHSCGCITILRYLEKLPAGAKIGKAVLVAGFTDNLGFKELDNYFQKPIDWKNIKSHCKDFVAIYSDNDQYVPVAHAEIFKKELGAKVIVEHGKKHMGGNDGITELPSVLDALLKG
jgi:hypothetical protein